MQARLQEEQEAAVANMEQAAASSRFSESWVQHAQEQHACRICTRKFETEQQCKEFIERFTKAKCEASPQCPLLLSLAR